jgi:SAM-dependent methyltransferase
MPLLERRINRESLFCTDFEFNQIYPLNIQALARRHWTPLNVARKAANFLATKNIVKVLDIGSGVGKFCLSAAYYEPKAFFYGVEQRRSLIDYAEKAKENLNLANVSFINGNFTQLDFKNYDHFYFYNAFYENLTDTDKIDDSIDYSGELFNYYNRYLFLQLEQKPTGTRLATFHSVEDEVPPGYKVVDSEMDNLLKFWIKVLILKSLCGLILIIK